MAVYNVLTYSTCTFTVHASKQNSFLMLAYKFSWPNEGKAPRIPAFLRTQLPGRLSAMLAKCMESSLHTCMPVDAVAGAALCHAGKMYEKLPAYLRG